MKLNAVKSSLFGQRKRVLEFIFNCLDIFECCLLGHRVLDSGEERDLLSGPNWRRSDWVESSIQMRVGYSSSVVDLNKHLSPLRSDTIHHLFPGLSLLLAVEAALIRVADASLGDCDALSQDQPSASSLGVVFPHQICWHSVFRAPDASQGRHNYSVFQLKPSKRHNVSPSFTHLQQQINFLFKPLKYCILDFKFLFSDCQKKIIMNYSKLITHIFTFDWDSHENFDQQLIKVKVQIRIRFYLYVTISPLTLFL